MTDMLKAIIHVIPQQCRWTLGVSLSSDLISSIKSDESKLHERKSSGLLTLGGHCARLVILKHCFQVLALFRLLF